MPELPEVETTKRGISPYVLNTTIEKVIVRDRRLRWPIKPNLEKILKSQTLLEVKRRSKYLLFVLTSGHLIIHLGMSGRLCLVSKKDAPLKHSHVDIILSSGMLLRYTDARRFGAVLWASNEDYPNIEEHPLLCHLGVEPLEKKFNALYLYKAIQKKTVDIKIFLMNAKYVVGIGNIYAQEALFLAHILPTRKACSLSMEECKALVVAIKKVLKDALKAGGTSFRDFIQADGTKGYFQLNLWVYGRSDLLCKKCQSELITLKQGGRTTTYCRICQH